MPSGRDRFRVELDVNAANAVDRSAHGALPDTVRIALLGDFSGRESRAETLDHGRALAARRSVRVDRDSLDEVIARFRPRVRWSDVSERPIDIELTSLEDFHPDRLYDRLPIFRALREAKDRAAVGPLPSDGSSPRPRSPAGASVLEAMLGDMPEPPAGAAVARVQQTPTSYEAGFVPDLVRRVVAPHLIADTGESSPRVADIDAAIVSTLRLLLHSPDFQRLEALWRGVDFLLRRLDTDERVQIHLIDIAPGELRLDLTGDPARSGLFRLLADQTVGTPGAPTWSLIVGCYTLGEDASDVAVLKGLAGVARASGAPLVIGGHPALAGCRSFAASPDPEDWTESEPDGWSELRESLDALCVGVVLPRFLLRLPYGERTDPCDMLRFEETTGEGLLEHECYLWGNGALAAALLLGDVLARGEDAGPPARRIGGLPLHVVRAGGDVVAKPCSEVLLGERDAEHLLDRGVMPLMWVKDSDEIVLPRLQSIAAPVAPLAFERRALGAPKPVRG